MSSVDVRSGSEIRALVDALGAAEVAGDWDRWRSLHAEDVIMDYPVLGAVVGVHQNLAIVRAFGSGLSVPEPHPA